MGHGFEAGFPIYSDGLGQCGRGQQLREIAAAASKCQKSEEEAEDQSRKRYQMDRAIEFVTQWVKENTTRLNGLVENSAALGLGEAPLFTGHEFFGWLLEQRLSQSHVCDYEGSARISRALQAQLEIALQVAIDVTCWGFYANWKA